MKNFAISFLKLASLLIVVIICTTCTKWDESSVKIERFEFLDEFYSDSYKTDSPILGVEAYLIHGYHKKHDEKIQEITNNYVCDSLIPNDRFYRTRSITFFRKTKNTNRENFQVRPKHKNIYARSNDKLFSYRLTTKDSSIFKITKVYHAYGPEISFQDFSCDGR